MLKKRRLTHASTYGMNVTRLVLVTLQGRAEKEKRLSHKEKDPMTSKEL